MGGITQKRPIKSHLFGILLIQRGTERERDSQLQWQKVAQRGIDEARCPGRTRRAIDRVAVRR